MNERQQTPKYVSVEVKNKLITQQLVMLLHAIRCIRRANEEGFRPCVLAHCTEMRNVLSHQQRCNDIDHVRPVCPVPHCHSSRHILGHWRYCVNDHCPVCSPIRRGRFLPPKEWSLSAEHRHCATDLLQQTGYTYPSEEETYVYEMAENREDYYRSLATRIRQLEINIKENLPQQERI